MQISTLRDGPPGVHWKKHWPGPPPFEMHWTKQITSLMQSGSWKQDATWSQQFSATQSPQALPSEGQIGGGPPQVPPLHWPVQHSASPPQAAPSGLHIIPVHFWLLGLQIMLQHWPEAMQSAPFGRHAGGPQTPPLHSPEQHSAATPHIAPSGAHGVVQVPIEQRPVQQSLLSTQPDPSGMQPPQIPAAHWLLQHSASNAHGEPLKAQGPQASPQTEATSFTQSPSQKLWQQKGSCMQIAATQGLHPAASASPSMHWSCGQG